MQCCQPHSNPSFSLFFSTLHRLPSSVNILKCLPLLLSASQKWWICNSDWLWRLVKNSLFLSHPPVKRVHFFPLTVARLPTHAALFSKTHNVKKGTFISSSLPLFNPLLTIHLSVSLHVEMGSIVGVCARVYAYFSKEDSVVCRQSNMLTPSIPHRGDVKTCGSVWLITPDSEKTLKIAVSGRKQGCLCSLWELVSFSLDQTLSCWDECQAKKVPESTFKVYHRLIAMLAVLHCFRCRRVSESLLIQNLH